MATMEDDRRYSQCSMHRTCWIVNTILSSEAVSSNRSCQNLRRLQLFIFATTESISTHDDDALVILKILFT